MKRVGIDGFIGLLVLYITVIVIFGWWQEKLVLVQFGKDSDVMVFNTALAFLIASVPLILCIFDKTILTNSAFRYVGFFLIFYGFIGLFQNIFQINLGVDEFFIDDWTSSQALLTDHIPGRDPIHKNLGFILLGYLYRSVIIKPKKFINSYMYLLLFALIMVSGYALLVYYLEIRVSSIFFRYTDVSVGTSICFLLTAIGTWIHWYKVWHIKDDLGTQSITGKITSVTIALLFVVAFIGSLSGFSILYKQTENSIVTGLDFIRNNEEALIKLIIRDGKNSIRFFNGLILNELSKVDIEGNASVNIDVVNQITDQLTGLKVVDNEGKLLFSHGQYFDNPDIILNITKDFYLIWKNGVFLQFNSKTPDGKAVFISKRLQNLESILREPVIGVSDANLFICGMNPDGTVNCLPTSGYYNGVRNQDLSKSPVMKGIKLAFEGKTGIEISELEGDPVFSSYAKIPNYKLAFSVNFDSGDLFDEIRNKMFLSFLVLIILIMISIYIVRSQITTVVNLLEVSDFNLKAKSDALEFIANHDHLTGLYTRRAFYDKAEHAIAIARRNQSTLAVMYIDLDKFKQINDSMSHESGDELLRMFSERLRDCLRDSDTIARLGGDEFGVLIENTKIEDVKIVAEKILKQVKKPFTILGREIVISNSIGIAMFNGLVDQEIRVQPLLHNADIALYESKNMGRDTYRIYSSGHLVD